jgi:hypothetical protein
MKKSELRAIIMECIIEEASSKGYAKDYWWDKKWIKSVEAALKHIDFWDLAGDSGVVIVSNSHNQKKVQDALEKAGVDPMPDVKVEG